MSKPVLSLITKDVINGRRETQVLAHRSRKQDHAIVQIMQTFNHTVTDICLPPAEARLLAKGLINAANHAEGKA